MERIDPSASPPLDFRWRDRNGEFHRPCDMTTQHVFYVLRMIWNHSMPSELQMEPFRRYAFDSFYTDEYMKTATLALGTELCRRDDLTPWIRHQLDFMAAGFKRLRLEAAAA